MTTEDSQRTGPRVVLITGAAGGLGSALVEAFASAGWNVAATSRRSSSRKATEHVIPAIMDVTDRRQVIEVVKQFEQRWGRIDALINNAGVTADGSLARLAEADWDRVLAVNLQGAFHCAQAVVRGMMRRRGGHILNISSHSGKCGAVGQANYAAAKASLLGFTKSLAREVGSRNVQVNAILPGVLPTRMTESLSADTLEEFRSANVLGRLNSLDEVARFVVFLTGMENVSGQVFHLDSRIAGW